MGNMVAHSQGEGSNYPGEVLSDQNPDRVVAANRAMLNESGSSSLRVPFVAHRAKIRMGRDSNAPH